MGLVNFKIFRFTITRRKYHREKKSCGSFCVSVKCMFPNHWSPIQPGVMQVLAAAALAPVVAGSESLELVTTRAITRLTLTANI